MRQRTLSWDQRILARTRPSIDPTLVAESLRLTPTKRLERLQKMYDFVELAHRRPADDVQGPARDSGQR